MPLFAYTTKDSKRLEQQNQTKKRKLVVDIRSVNNTQSSRKKKEFPFDDTDIEGKKNSDVFTGCSISLAINFVLEPVGSNAFHGTAQCYFCIFT